MQRIYLPNIHFTQELILDTPELHHQITRVLRARKGDEFIFFDGKTTQDFHYVIQEISKYSLVLKLTTIQDKKSEIFPHLHLYQALPNKWEKIEFMVQKCTEIGYRSLTFFLSDHSQKIEISEKKRQRIEKIMIEALEQCGGNILPELYFEDSFPEEKISEGEKIFCHTQKDMTLWLSQWDIPKTQNISIVVGPEGGFSQREVEAFKKMKYTGVHFWPRILRCETVWMSIGFYLSQK